MKIYTSNDVATLTEDLANSIKLIQALPENTVEATTAAFMQSLSIQQLIAVEFIRYIQEDGESLSEEEAEKKATHCAIALNTIQGCGIDLNLKDADISEDERERVLSVLELMGERRNPSPLARPPAEAHDDPWG